MGVGAARGPRRPGRLAVALAATAAVLALVACQPPAPPPAGPATGGPCRPDPFTPDVVRFFTAWGERHHLSAAAYDDRTGCWYHLARGRRVTTASVVKVEIMAGVLLRAQDQRRGLTAAERARLSPMIRASDNATASALWVSLGGRPGMARVGDRFGLTETTEVAPTWGLTVTTAEDQARFVHRLLQGPGPLDAAGRGEAWAYLRDIRADQRWGVRAGVPPGWEVGHKNGFAGSRCCGWRVNSVGYVSDPAGGGYALAVLSDGWPNQAAGVPLVEAVAATVARSLTGTVPAG